MFLKRMVVLAAALGLFVVVAGVATGLAPTDAAAQPENTSQACKEFFEDYIESIAEYFGLDFDVSHGACVALLTNRNVTPLAADLCREPEFAAKFGNHGQCVREVTPILEELLEEFLDE